MIMLRKFVLLILMAAPMAITSTAALSAGKIKNATMEEVTASIDAAIKNTADALASVNSNAEKEVTLGYITDAKQASIGIESSRLGMLRGKALRDLRIGKTAVKKDDPEKAKKHLASSLELFKKIMAKFVNFDGEQF